MVRTTKLFTHRQIVSPKEIRKQKRRGNEILDRFTSKGQLWIIFKVYMYTVQYSYTFAFTFRQQLLEKLIIKLNQKYIQLKSAHNFLISWICLTSLQLQFNQILEQYNIFSKIYNQKTQNKKLE